ncbi:MAG: hypothetical protein H8E05_00940 [Bacteroidetes bacterium]|nr:hypothetical protein [Bacteroidota bacterium]
MKDNKKRRFSPREIEEDGVDDIPFDRQKKYFKSKKGKKALKRARKKYDEKDPDRRRRQKRDYMRRLREKEKYGES